MLICVHNLTSAIGFGLNRLVRKLGRKSASPLFLPLLLTCGFVTEMSTKKRSCLTFNHIKMFLGNRVCLFLFTNTPLTVDFSAAWLVPPKISDRGVGQATAHARRRHGHIPHSTLQMQHGHTKPASLLLNTHEQLPGSSGTREDDHCSLPSGLHIRTGVQVPSLF